MSRPPLEVADVVRQHGAAFLARNGTSLNPSSIRKMVTKYYKKAGVRKSGVHTLRHNLESLLMPRAHLIRSS